MHGTMSLKFADYSSGYPFKFKILFYVLLAVHLGIIFGNNQLDAQFFFMYVYFYPLRAHHQEN